MGVVEARGLCKAYGRGAARVEALVGVDVQVRAGVLTAVVGPSGSGKSTLLHCLSGVAVPDAGEVRVGEKLLSGLSDDELAALRRTSFGFVFQRGNLLPALTVAENVAAGLVLRGEGRDAVAAKVDAALARVGLPDRADAFPAELSGGQAQRVALARALAAEPQVLFADEPTGALDRAAAEQLLGLLHDAAGQGTAVVVVSHDPCVEQAAGAVVRLTDGRRVA